METLKFITQTTNYVDNELSLIAERITFPSLKRFQPEIHDYNIIEEIDVFASTKRAWRDLLHSTRNDLQLTFSGHGLGIISKSDFDH